MGLSIICLKDMSTCGEEGTLRSNSIPSLVTEEGIGVGWVEESPNVEETGVDAGEGEPTGETGIVLDTLLSLLFTVIEDIIKFGLMKGGMEAASSFPIEFGSDAASGVGEDEPTGDGGAKLVIFRHSVTAGVDSMGFGVQV